MILTGITTGLSVLFDWIPIAGMVVLIPAFLIRRHRYRQEKRRLEAVIASYQAASGQDEKKQEKANG